MKLSPFNTYALLGAAGGFGFGIFVMPLVYLLVTVGGGPSSLDRLIWFALGNAFTWGVFGLFAGVFAAFILRVRETGRD